MLPTLASNVGCVPALPETGGDQYLLNLVLTKTRLWFVPCMLFHCFRQHFSFFFFNREWRPSAYSFLQKQREVSGRDLVGAVTGGSPVSCLGWKCRFSEPVRRDGELIVHGLFPREDLNQNI